MSTKSVGLKFHLRFHWQYRIADQWSYRTAHSAAAAATKTQPKKSMKVTTLSVINHIYWLISQNDPLLTWILPSIHFFIGWKFSLRTDQKCLYWVLVQNLNQQNLLQVAMSSVVNHIYWLISQNDPFLTWILPSIQLFASWKFSLNTDWKCFAGYWS